MQFSKLILLIVLNILISLWPRANKQQKSKIELFLPSSCGCDCGGYTLPAYSMYLMLFVYHLSTFTNKNIVLCLVLGALEF